MAKMRTLLVGCCWLLACSGGQAESPPQPDRLPVAPAGGPTDCAAIMAQGDALGQVASSWTLTNERGQPVSLHDYCGKVIFLEAGAEW